MEQERWDAEARIPLSDGWFEELTKSPGTLGRNTPCSFQTGSAGGGAIGHATQG